MEELWKNFTYSIKHQNRYFPNDTNIIDKLNKILDKLIRFSSGTFLCGLTVYRARVGEFIDEEALRKPPTEKASDGRCNPRGISYFYTACNVETSIHEVKPNINEIVTVGTFRTEENLQISDFKSIELIETEFGCGKFILTNDEKTLLTIILDELKKPINNSQDIDYIPIQYIVEYIKQKTSYDGFSFCSSYGLGKNYIFFDDINFKLIEPLEHYTINKISYSFKKL